MTVNTLMCTAFYLVVQQKNKLKKLKMDFSRFSDPGFDVKEWVNAALRAHKDTQTPVDAHASTLVMKLQLFIQEVNSALEETSMQVVQNLPRVLRDVEAVRQEATLLREQMQVVREDIKKVESETAQSMQRLVELDAIKTRMLESQNALQEADNWTTLSADVEEVFASQDIHKIAEKLAGMQQSLNVLHDVPDFEERKKLLETLKNRLEALVSPKLIAAFNSHILAEAQQYVRIFTDIERYPLLRNYYIGCHKTGILQLWGSVYNSSKPLLECLSTFYNELLSKWHSEYSWCSQVFPDPLSMLTHLFSQALDMLEPPLGRCLQNATQGSQSSLATLLELRGAALRFVKGLERALGGTQDAGAVFPLVEVVHMPYCRLLVQYPSMEARLLGGRLERVPLESPAVEDTVGMMADSIPKIVMFASEALERCLQLTEGWGLGGLVRALETLFSQYLSKLSAGILSLRKGCGLELEVGRSRERGEELTHLQSAFRIIQCCGEMLLQMSALNSEVCAAVVNHTGSLRTPASETHPFGCYDYLTVYHPEQHTAMMELITAVEKGGGEWPLLVSTTNQIHSLNEKAHLFAFDLLFARLKRRLTNVPHLKVWETGIMSPLESPRAITDDLPSFSLSPLPYITEIGDYLLTLPQQLEPFTSQESPALVAALKEGRLPFPDTEVTELPEGEEGEEHPSDVWLGAVARATMDTYLRRILLIPSIPPPAAHQLATDISYLCNVLAALGQHPSQQLVQLETLFKVDREEFLKLKEDKMLSRQLFQSVAKLRTWYN